MIHKYAFFPYLCVPNSLSWICFQQNLNLKPTEKGVFLVVSRNRRHSAKITNISY